MMPILRFSVKEIINSFCAASHKILLPRWERVTGSFAIAYTYTSCLAQSVVKSLSII